MQWISTQYTCSMLTMAVQSEESLDNCKRRLVHRREPKAGEGKRMKRDDEVAQTVATQSSDSEKQRYLLLHPISSWASLLTAS